MMIEERIYVFRDGTWCEIALDEPNLSDKLEAWTDIAGSGLYRARDEVGQPVHHRAARQQTSCDRDVSRLAVEAAKTSS